MTEQTVDSLEHENKIRTAFAALASNDTHPSAATEDVVRILAAESRLDLDVRQRLSSLENLGYLVAVINRHISAQAVESAIRCIGNACAENNTGRENITSIGLNWANDCLDSGSVNEDVKLVLVKALYNICIDYEPAQQSFYRDEIHYRLIKFCGTAHVQESDDASLVIDLIFYICGHKPNVDATLKEYLPHEVLEQLLDLPKIYAHDSETDTFASLVESILVFLRDTTVQNQMIHEDKLHDCWELLQILNAGITSLSTEREEDDEDLKILIPLSASLTWCLSDIAALPEFMTTYTLECALIKQLIELVKTGGIDQTIDGEQTPSRILLTAACQVIGNLLWALPPATYLHLIDVDQLHQACFRFIVQSLPDMASSEVIHALAGLLIQLTRPSVAIRECIGADKNCQPALQRLSEHESPLIKQDAVRLIKVLGKDCPVNQGRFEEMAKGILVSLKDAHEQQPQGQMRAAA